MQNNNYNKDVEKLEPSYTAGEDILWCVDNVKNSLAFSQKVKHKVTTRSAIPLLGM